MLVVIPSFIYVGQGISSITCLVDLMLVSFNLRRDSDTLLAKTKEYLELGHEFNNTGDVSFYAGNITQVSNEVEYQLAKETENMHEDWINHVR